MGSQKTQMNQVAATLSRQCQRKGRLTAKSPLPTQSQTAQTNKTNQRRKTNHRRTQQPSRRKHPTEEENTPEVNTPPPSTPVQCSTSYGTHPTQPEGELQTPIRATVSAEVTPKKGTTSPRKGNLKTIEKKEPKNYKMPIEPSADLRRFNRIKDAKRTVKLGGVEYF